MKKRFLFLLLGWLFAIALFSQVQGLYINEFMASNDTAYADEQGEYDDWIELYNASNEPIDIGGMYITDDLSDLTLYQIPDTDPDQTTIDPEDFLILWADKDLNQGILHVNIKLSGSGEEIGLTASDGVTVIDQITFGPQTTDVSYGRYPDGSEHWEFMPQYTPGYENESSNMPPILDNWAQFPLSPLANQDVTVQITATDDSKNITQIQLIYEEDGDMHTLDMYDDGQHNDNQANDNIYGTVIPGMGMGTEVTYYIRAEDDFGATTTYPTNTDLAKIKYVCGYEPPNVVINEFMADNSETIEDPQGSYEDWIELYNNSDEPINIADFYITDNLQNPENWYKIPNTYPDSTTIAPHGFLLLWADNDAEDGITHLPFKLSSSGESIGLFAFYATTPIDTLSYGEQSTDISYGRYPDGSDNWEFFNTPTPGSPNQLNAVNPTEMASIIQNAKSYPNPFNPNTNISFSLKEKTDVTVDIYNLKGQKVITLFEGKMNKGTHSLSWNAKSQPSGIYLYNISSKQTTITGKMILLK